MSVKQDIQRLKEMLDELPPDEKAYFLSLVPAIMHHGPRIADILSRIDGFMGIVMSLALPAFSEGGREKIGAAIAEVFRS